MMSSASVQACPECGGAIPRNAPMNMCPACLWRVSVDDDPVGDESDEPWAVLGSCELFEEIARGGMGVVYRARQPTLDRDVAVKIVRGGEFADPTARRRFEAEARAAARLQHPGIVGIHEVGEADGVPWFSMDLLPGGNLAQWVGETPRPSREAARCVQAVAAAVQHAHDHGILHRDLKPSNILRAADGSPMVTDFGLAAPTSPELASRLTLTGQTLGSPGYAAPELALQGKADERTDIYGLGALLYFLLTARPPFQGPTLDAILLQLREGDPVPPRRLNPTVPPDLETICLRCLAKEPGSRYENAAEVAADLDRFLSGKSIHARPLSVGEHFLRWCRRHPGVAVLMALVLFLLAGLTVSGFLYGVHHSRLEKRAELMAKARILLASGVNDSRSRALMALRSAWAIHPSAEIRNEAIACLSQPEIIFGGVVKARVAPSPADTKSAFSVKTEGSRQLKVFNARSGGLLHTLEHSRPIFCFDSRDNLLATMTEDRFLSIWDLTSGARSHRLSGHEGLPAAAVFRHGGQELASVAMDAHVRLWHGALGKELAHFDGAEPHSGPAWWEDNDSRFYATRMDGMGVDEFHVKWPASVRILAPATEELRTENTRSLSLSPDGLLAATVDERVLRVWDIPAARVLATLPKSPTEWMTAGFSPDGKALWVCGFDTKLLRLAITRGPQGNTSVGPPEVITPIAGALLADISADGNRLVLSHNHDGKWLLWSAGQPLVELPAKDLLEASFSPDDRLVATSSYSVSGVKVWDTEFGRLEKEIPTDSPAQLVRFTPDGRNLWVLTERFLQRFNTNSSQPEFSMPSNGLRGLEFSPDCRMAACYQKGAIILLDGMDLSELARLAVPESVGWVGNASLAFNSNATVLALHTALGAVVIWNLESLEKELTELGMNW